MSDTDKREGAREEFVDCPLCCKLGGIKRMGQSISSESEAAYADTVAYGVGFIAIGADLSFKRLSIDEVIKKAEEAKPGGADE